MRKLLSRVLKKSATVSVLLATCLALAAHAQTAVAQTDPARTGGDPQHLSLDEWLQPHREQHALPGIGAMVVDDRNVLAFGLSGRRSTNHDAALQLSDRWHLGSITKSMAATVAARLVAAGKVRWQDTVLEVLPDRFPDMHPDYRDVTLEQLLRHRSGLTDDLTGLSVWQEIDTSTMAPGLQRQHLLAEVLQLPPGFTPGQGWRYSNAGYVLAGVMMEQASGTSWEQLVEAELFRPLGLQNAGIGAPGSAGAVPDQPRGHRHHEGTLSAVEPGPFADHPPAMAPAGTVHMSLHDLGLYLQAHLAGLRDGHPLMPSNLFARLHEPEGDERYASGWFVTPAEGGAGPISSHEGSNTFWMALVWVAPAENIALAVVTNRVPEDIDALIRIAGQLLTDYRAGDLS